jgi:hypothetical protein
VTGPESTAGSDTITDSRAIRVGVTGHRPAGLAGADLVLLRHRIRDALELVTTTDAGAPLIVISPLAEGADRLVAREAVAAGYLLDCVLPFQRDDYATDFASAAARSEYYALLGVAQQIIELDGSRETPASTDAAYMAAGEHVVAHANVVIAIWDGAAARGSGGTGDIVALALAHDRPILWITASHPHDIHLITRDGDTYSERPLAELPELVNGRRD